MKDQRKLAIVTGAAGGIGQALLARFAACGHRLVAVDLPGTGLHDIIAAHGPDHIVHECDLGDEEAVMALFARIDRDAGRVDILANNAALGPTFAPTLQTDAAGFRRTLRVNVASPFLMAREAARRMGRGGVIVNTASQAGVLGNPRRNAYAASKAALISLTRSLACEWADRGIRVTAIAPGYVRTPMVAALEASGKADLALVRRRIPLGRIARPDEMAAVAGFLASDAARYITGSCLAVDGAWAAFNQPGHAHPEVAGTPDRELTPAPGREHPRVVVVTGGGRGIGQAIARRHAAAGDMLVILDRAGAEDAATDLGEGHMGISLDLTDDAALAAAFAAIAARHGHVDVLVNNAAVMDVFRPALDQLTADFERVLEINLTAAFNATREALPLMHGRPGVVINMGSINSFLPFAPRHAYGASKAAIDVLTRCLAAELGPEGHRVVTLAPGYIRTPAIAALEAEGLIDTRAIRRRIPLGDMGRPEDIAEAAFFLASPDASYVSGAALYVDGGWTSFGSAGDASNGGHED